MLGPAPAPPAPPAAAPAPVLALSKAPAAEPVQISILSPTPGQTLDLADAAGTPITVHSPRPEWLLELGLDGRRARPVATLPEQPTLGDLNDGAPLAAGAHYLVAALRAADDAPARYAIARFSVQSPAQASAPLVYCGRPSGTYYGSEGTLLLDFTTDGFEPGASGAVLVRALQGDAKKPAPEALLRDSAPHLVDGLAVGDWSIELSLLGPEGKPLDGPLSRHRCELTRNEGPP